MTITGNAVDAVQSTSPRKVTVTASSALALAANPGRAGSQWVNDSAVTIYLGLGAAAVVGSDVALSPTGSWDGRVAGLVWTGAVYAIAASGSSNNLCVVEV